MIRLENIRFPLNIHLEETDEEGYSYFISFFSSNEDVPNTDRTCQTDRRKPRRTFVCLILFELKPVCLRRPPTRETPPIVTVPKRSNLYRHFRILFAVSHPTKMIKVRSNRVPVKKFDKKPGWMHKKYLDKNRDADKIYTEI